MSLEKRLRFAAKLSLFHLIISIVVASLTALLVFKAWYAYPFYLSLGGLTLFFLVASVDVVCGPLMTLILANPEKSRKETILDLSLVGIIQLSALIYGMHTVYIARPVYYAFDKDRFSTVTVAQLEKDDIAKAVPELQNLPKMGPRQISLKKSQSSNMDDIMLSFSGIEPIARPNNWQVYDKERDITSVRATMKPVAELYKLHHNKDKKLIIDKAVARTNLEPDKVFFVPFTTDKSLDWSALLDENGEIVGYVDADGFQ
ncbi:MAG: fimb protein [Neisseriaceae bacterium]|nr:fimb protein [Neisseriaceae bacterium]